MSGVAWVAMRLPFTHLAGPLTAPASRTAAPRRRTRRLEGAGPSHLGEPQLIAGMCGERVLGHERVGHLPGDVGLSPLAS
jgi:hypothetical protein